MDILAPPPSHDTVYGACWAISRAVDCLRVAYDRIDEADTGVGPEIWALIAHIEDATENLVELIEAEQGV